MRAAHTGRNEPLGLQGTFRSPIQNVIDHVQQVISTADGFSVSSGDLDGVGLCIDDAKWLALLPASSREVRERYGLAT